MSGWSEYFLNSDSSIQQLELLEISHPNFSKTYYIVRNAINGITVTLEDSTVQTFDYYPVQIEPTGSEDDLDQTIKIQLGDLGDVGLSDLLPAELDNIAAADGFLIKPICRYRTYRSDDLTAPLSGPLDFEIVTLPMKQDGAAFEARAPRLNQLGTGEIYTVGRFPMLAGFI